jgi:co-chaperonin GroES (HSP10)
MKLRDRYLVKIENRHETEFRHGSLLLEKPVLSDRIESKDMKKCSYNPDEHLTKKGVIISLPHSLTGTNARMVNVGHPQHSRYISSEMILATREDPSNYNPSTYVDTYLSHKELYRVEAAVGDILHFYHTAIDSNDPVMQDLYALNVANVFAYQKGKEIHMCHGFVLCEYIKAKTVSEGGVHLPMKQGNELNMGKVAFAPACSELASGEVVYYKKNADYVINIEGKEYFVVREYDCLCAMG